MALHKTLFRPRKRIAAFIFLLILFAVVCTGMSLAAPDNTVVLYASADTDEKPLRLHILANSDSAWDQEVKLLLRDEILLQMEAVLADCASKDEAMAALAEALPDIEAACNRFLQDLDMGYGAVCRIQRTDFPDVSYDGVVYAAGEYDALRILLGEGAGHNWWCVLFPPLCFVDVAAEEDTAVPAMNGENTDGFRVAWKFQELL